MTTLNQHHVKPGQVWANIDERNTDRGKTGRAKPKRREVLIVALPTLSSPGVMKVLKAPKAGHTIGALREFSYSKLELHYIRVS